MGITIHYSGTFRSDVPLGALIKEAAAFAEANNWKYLVLETCFPETPPLEPHPVMGQYGILVFPPECEAVHLIFNHDRRLGYFCDLRSVLIQDLVVNEITREFNWVNHHMDQDYKPDWGAFTKTQLAGSAAHIKVVELLKQLAPKYFSEFEVTDETDFWDDGNEKNLRLRFGDELK